MVGIVYYPDFIFINKNGAELLGEYLPFAIKNQLIEEIDYGSIH